MRKTNVFMITLFLFTISFGSQKDLLDFIDLKMKSEIVPSIDRSRSFFGFADDDDLSKIKIEAPMEVCKIPYSVLDTCSDSIAVPTILQSAKKWYVPLMLNERVKIFFEIKGDSGTYRVGAIGMTSIADAWNSVLELTTKKKYKKVVFVELREINSFSFYIPDEGNDNLTPLLMNFSPDKGLLKAPTNAYENVTNSKSTITDIKLTVHSMKRVKK